MKKITLLCISFIMCANLMFAQESATPKTPSYGQDLVQGLEAYKIGDWENALFFLKRTSNFQEAQSDSVWYFVIMAEMNLSDYSAVVRDGTAFLNIFKDSKYISEITYQVLLAEYELQMFDEAIAGFTTFIDTYPTHDLVSSAIYHTGEALYKVYEFDRAKSYFDTLIAQYPNSTHYDDALFRLELLQQREREEKLLYLLRVTGEEAVAAKEDYERQIKQLQSEEAIILRKRVQELEQNYSRLEVEKQELLIQNESLKNTVQELNTLIATKEEAQPVVVENVNTSTPAQSNDLLIDDLTRKALELQKLLEEN